MTISKAHFDTNGEDLRLSMPFSKVDKERRIVSGFATLDNLDRQNDIVLPEASLKAFQKFRGNIREMHQPISVGKMVGFKEDKYFDPETKKFYSGIYVSAYVSKGAQDTWEKVLDGTLSGFSIGGKMNKFDNAYNAELDKTVRIIKEYDLFELSLVDSPANQLANFVSIEKMDAADIEKSDTVLENVFWDSTSGLVLLSQNESETSPTTGAQMENIGFVEKNDSEKTEMIKFLVDSAKGINTSKMNKEVSPMTDTTNDVVEETTVEESQVAPEADATAEAVAEEAVAADVEKSADADEDDVPGTEVAEEADDMSGTEDDEEEVAKSDSVAGEEVSKSDDAIVSSVAEIKNSITSAFSDLAVTIKALNEQVSALSKSLDTANSEIAAVKSEVANAKSEFNEFGKRVDAVEADTAFRKSGDLGEIVQENEPEQVQKSLWGGRFLKTADLLK
jgi:outer membrane murein-binding lipoprotein Lpp